MDKGYIMLAHTCTKEWMLGKLRKGPAIACECETSATIDVPEADIENHNLDIGEEVFKTFDKLIRYWADKTGNKISWRVEKEELYMGFCLIYAQSVARFRAPKITATPEDYTSARANFLKYLNWRCSCYYKTVVQASGSGWLHKHGALKPEFSTHDLRFKQKRSQYNTCAFISKGKCGITPKEDCKYGKEESPECKRWQFWRMDKRVNEVHFDDNKSAGESNTEDTVVETLYVRDNEHPVGRRGCISQRCKEDKGEC
jgi:hypothetical protein